MPKTTAEGERFGGHLREMRLRRQLTQRQLAELCDSNEPFISNLERGVKIPSLSMLIRLANALGCKVAELVRPFDQSRR
jgi:transcriptional regulator with XRE-family HTH domain